MSKQKFWNFNDSSELVLDGVIASESWYGDEVTPQLFRDELAEHRGDLTVVINSPGGDVFAGVAIYNALKNRNGGKTTVRVDGVAASIASVIAMAGDTIKMSLGSTMMIHKPWSMAVGDATELAKTIELLDKLEGSIVDIYADRTSLEKDEIVELLAAETWLTPEEAVTLGFADEAPEKRASLSNTMRNVKDLLAPIQNAVMQPMMSIQVKAEQPQVEEANATDTTTSTDETAEQAVEVEPPVETEAPAEVETPEAEEVEETEVQEATVPVTEETIEPVEHKEKEIKAMTKIAESQVIEPKAQAPVKPAVDANAWFKTKDAVEAFTMALASNAGKSFNDVEVQNAYKEAQVKAGIADPSVFTLPEPVVTSIEDAVKSGEIYSRMNHTGLDVIRLMYDDADSEVDTSRAGGFNPAYESEGVGDRTKEDQILDFESRVIRAQYIYKYLVLGKETVRENRSTGALVRFVLNELPVRIIRELERAAIIGDGRAAGSKRKITSFVSVKSDAAANAGAGNAFAGTYTRTAGMSLAEAVRRAATEIEADGEIVLIAKRGFGVNAQFERDADGKLMFPIGTTAAAVLGVSTIIEPTWFTDAADAENDAYLVVLSKYATVGDNSIEAFTNFKLETNENEFLQEVYKGGALSAIKSAVAIPATVTE